MYGENKKIDNLINIERKKELKKCHWKENITAYRKEGNVTEDILRKIKLIKKNDIVMKYLYEVGIVWKKKAAKKNCLKENRKEKEKKGNYVKN